MRAGDNRNNRRKKKGKIESVGWKVSVGFNLVNMCVYVKKKKIKEKKEIPLDTGIVRYLIKKNIRGRIYVE